jgi:hypothetical protein
LYCPTCWENHYEGIPTVSSWWSQWEVMAASHCHLWQRWCMILCQHSQVITALVLVVLILFMLEWIQWLALIS